VTQVQSNSTEYIFIPNLDQDNSLKLDEFWCGGKRNRGCGKKLSFFLVQHDTDGFFVCPYCGRRS